MNRKILTYLPLAIVLAIFIYQLIQSNPRLAPNPPPPQATQSSGQPLGSRTKTSGCTARGALPDSACTPGAIIPAATKEPICVNGYSKSVRNVPSSVKAAVYREYGITSHATGEYEVDHLISLELGGSNDIANLWPEAANPTPGFHEKDLVENQLHEQVCNGSISLVDAQKGIAANWLQIYQGIR